MGRDKDANESLQRRNIAVQNSDFISYLNSIVEAPNELTLPSAISDAFQIQLKSFPAQELYTFLVFKPEFDFKTNEPRTYNHIVREAQNSSTLIVGESGNREDIIIDANCSRVFCILLTL